MRGFLAQPIWGWRHLAVAAALGGVIALGQAPWGLWFLALPALCGFVAMVALAPGGWWRVARIGWLGGAGYFAVAMFWIVEPFFVDMARHGWMAPFALPMMAFGMALFWLAAAGLARWLAPAEGRRALVFAVTLAAMELTRSYILTGFPWALIGHIWIDTPVVQAAAWVGPLGLTLLTTISVALIIRGAAIGRWAPGLAAGAALLAGPWLFGVMQLRAGVPTDETYPILRLIQPNAEQHLKWQPEMAQVFFDRQLRQTATTSDPRPDLVIWPETAVPWLLNNPGPVLDMISAAAGGAPVALGIQRTEGLRGFNSLAVIENGATKLVYDKFHLVPFGEYIPLGDFMANFGISAFAAQEGKAYTAGPGPQVLDLGLLGKMQPLICYEVVFPQNIHAAPERPDWLLQVTNDGWFGKIAGPYQHLAQARLRAVEQGLPLIRVANTGVSAVIDARGRVLHQLPLGAAGFIDARLPVALPETPYARTGDWPVALLLALCLTGFALTRPKFSD